MDALIRQQADASLISNFQANTLKAGRDKFTAGYLRGRLEFLERYWTSFQANHERLLAIEDLQGEDYFKEDQFSRAELQYTTALGFLYDEEAKLATAVVQPNQAHSAQRNAHLPRISLPTFTGHADEWESYRDLFRSLIHLDKGLTGVQKLHYLKTSVQGEAKRAVDGITTTEANYAVAWQSLLDRYDNEHLLAQRHMYALASIGPLKDESNTGLQSLHDQVVRSYEALTALKRPVAQWGDWFILFASKAMDPVTRREWERKVRATEEVLTYESLTEFLRSSIQTLKTLEEPRSSRESTGNRPKLPSERSRSTNVLITTADKTSCFVCHGSHVLDQCQEFGRMEVGQRRAIANRSRSCYNCLRMGHNAHNCESRHRCQV